MVSIAVGYCYYNDLKSIQRGIPTFVDDVDFVFAIDGRFSLREGPDYSDDGSTEYLELFKNVIIRKFVGMEHDKRNVYMELCEEMDIDVLLIIDSDEFIMEGADWELFRDNIDKIKNEVSSIYGMKAYSGITESMEHYTMRGDEQFAIYPRVWINPGTIRYEKAHCIFRVNGNLIRSPPNLKPVEGVSLAMSDEFRDEDYLKKTSEYQAKMIKYEIPYRHALRDNKNMELFDG
jgi:hypothetical protein